MLIPLRNWHNKRIREIFRVTIHQVELYGITSVELQKRIGIWDLDYYVGRRTLQWVGHVCAWTRAVSRGVSSQRGFASHGRNSGRK